MGSKQLNQEWQKKLTSLVHVNNQSKVLNLVFDKKRKQSFILLVNISTNVSLKIYPHYYSNFILFKNMSTFVNVNTNLIDYLISFSVDIDILKKFKMIFKIFVGMDIKNIWISFKYSVLYLETAEFKSNYNVCPKVVNSVTTYAMIKESCIFFVNLYFPNYSNIAYIIREGNTIPDIVQLEYVISFSQCSSYQLIGIGFRELDLGYQEMLASLVQITQNKLLYLVFDNKCKQSLILCINISTNIYLKTYSYYNLNVILFMNMSTYVNFKINLIDYLISFCVDIDILKVLKMIFKIFLVMDIKMIFKIFLGIDINMIFKIFLGMDIKNILISFKYSVFYLETAEFKRIYNVCPKVVNSITTYAMMLDNINIPYIIREGCTVQDKVQLKYGISFGLSECHRLCSDLECSAHHKKLDLTIFHVLKDDTIEMVKDLLENQQTISPHFTRSSEKDFLMSIKLPEDLLLKSIIDMTKNNKNKNKLGTLEIRRLNVHLSLQEDSCNANLDVFIEVFDKGYKVIEEKKHFLVRAQISSSCILDFPRRWLCTLKRLAAQIFTDRQQLKDTILSFKDPPKPVGEKKHDVSFEIKIVRKNHVIKRHMVRKSPEYLLLLEDKSKPNSNFYTDDIDQILQMALDLFQSVGMSEIKDEINKNIEKLQLSDTQIRKTGVPFNLDGKFDQALGCMAKTSLISTYMRLALKSHQNKFKFISSFVCPGDEKNGKKG